MGEGRAGEPYDVPQANHRLTIAQAAVRLGISEGALRSRVKRGTTPTVKEAGRVYVVWGAGTSAANHATNTDEPTRGPTDQSELVAVLREQLAAEREANRENRRIIIALTSRVPELEASREPRESPTPSPETSEGTTPQPEREAAQEPAQRRPWWRGWFGG
jgi:hypothetical protein